MPANEDPRPEWWTNEHEAAALSAYDPAVHAPLEAQVPNEIEIKGIDLSESIMRIHEGLQPIRNEYTNKIAELKDFSMTFTGKITQDLPHGVIEGARTEIPLEPKEIEK